MTQARHRFSPHWPQCFAALLLCGIAGAARIEAAVRGALAQGYRTADIFAPGMQRVGTRAMGDAVAAAL